MTAEVRRPLLRRPATYLVGVPLALGAVLFAVAVVAPYVYIHVVEGPPPGELALDSARPAARTEGAPTAPVEGRWRVTGGSQAGYRVGESLFGQRTTAVGRTGVVSGELVIQGTTVRTGSFSVDLRTVTSDRAPRDERFRDHIMDTARFPTATFALTAPIPLRRIPRALDPIRTRARGRLTLRGTARPVAVDLDARRDGSGIEVSGSIPVRFARFGIPNPSFGPASTDDHGEVEFLLVLERAR